jgi:hypothetical protein
MGFVVKMDSKYLPESLVSISPSLCLSFLSVVLALTTPDHSMQGRAQDLGFGYSKIFKVQKKLAA